MLSDADRRAADRILSRAAWRLIPFMALMYVASFLDRVNISFAALTMNHDLGFSPKVYGFGAGVFFFGYFLFEVPSNLMLQKVGARLWMCRICVTWGLLSMLTAFVREPVGFCILRFLLGAAEAGLYPGMIFYMTYWFPAATRARFIALFLAGVPLANVLGAPLSGWLLGVSGHGLAGWQWMLILEGIPSLACGVATLWLLPDGPARAKWLSDAQKRIIAARLAADPPGALHGFKEMLLDRRIWLLMIPDFSIVIALYGLTLWQPQMVKAMGYSNLETGFIVALPYLLAVGAMVALGASSDRRGERAGHVAFAAFAGAAGMLGAVWFTDHGLVIAALCLAASGIYAALAVFWTLPSALLRGTAAAAGLALLNSFSNLGGFFGPYLMGWAKQATGDYTLGMALLAGMLVLAGVAVIWIGKAFFWEDGMTIRKATPDDEAPVVALWRACGLSVPHNDPAADFLFALDKPSSDILVMDEDGVIGSVMVGHDGHRGWLYYVAVDPARRRQGIGRALVRAAESWLSQRGVPKVQLMVRETNDAVAAFYRRIGYDPMPRINMQKWLKP